MLLVFGAVLLAFSEMAQAWGTKSKCDVVSALRKQNVPDSEIRDCKWTKKL